MSIDKGQLRWSAVRGEGSEYVAALCLLSLREASFIERVKEVDGLYPKLGDAAFVVEGEILDFLLEVEFGLKSVFLAKFCNDLEGVGVVGDESAGVAAEKIVEEAEEEVPLFGGRGMRVPESSRA